ncbi:MAG: hypothetical protein ABJM44_14950, partial [Marinomonas sp.]
MESAEINPARYAVFFGLGCLFPPIVTWLALTWREDSLFVSLFAYLLGAFPFILAFDRLKRRVFAGVLYLIFMAPVLAFVVL